MDIEVRREPDSHMVELLPSMSPYISFAHDLSHCLKVDDPNTLALATAERHTITANIDFFIFIIIIAMEDIYGQNTKMIMRRT